MEGEKVRGALVKVVPVVPCIHPRYLVCTLKGLPSQQKLFQSAVWSEFEVL